MGTKSRPMLRAEVLETVKTYAPINAESVGSLVGAPPIAVNDALANLWISGDIVPTPGSEDEWQVPA